MAGPGGGSRGGGFGGGSFGGGGGRGFGGGYGGYHHHYHRPFFFWGRPFGYYGGGCLGGLLGLIFLPIIILIMALIFIALLLSSVIGTVSAGGKIVYNETKFQDYANQQYYQEFNSEDGLMLVFLTGEEYDGYYCVAWAGENIVREINLMMGNEYTEFGQIVQRNINSTNYKYSLSSNLANMTEELSDAIQRKGLSTPFKQPQSEADKAILRNYTELGINTETVELALADFNSKTDIPIVIVVDTAEKVFGKTIPVTDIIILVLMIGVAGFSIYLLVKRIRQRRGGSGGSQGGYGNGYNNAFNNYNDFNP